MLLLVGLVTAGLDPPAGAHPLGNFTINHYARLTVGPERVRIRYVIDMAEISTLQELQKVGGSGDASPSASELNAALGRIAAEYVSNLFLTVDGHRVPLEVFDKTIALPPGAGGLPTLRVELTLEGSLPADPNAKVRHLAFEDRNRRERIGWREIVVESDAGARVFDSTAFGNGLTDEIKAYPQDRLAAPLREGAATFSLTSDVLPPGAVALRTRDGHPVSATRDPLADLINVPEVTPWVAFLGLLVAASLGGLHAFAPGHGKTIVGAYLVGARASLRHAVILGATVTVTHTLGVLVLGLITLFASEYVLPERLLPVLSFVSGAVVILMGVSLFAARLRNTRAVGPNGAGHLHGRDHHHGHDRIHPHEHGADDHTHAGYQHGRPLRHSHLPPTALVHSHGGREHAHALPDPGSLRLRSLLALGISGGLLPCPSALVVLLSAVALHRIGYGLLLVIAFSLGLAATLTGIGLLFIHAGRWMKRPAAPILQRLVRVLPAASALVITMIGAGICWEALVQAGGDLPGIVARVFASSADFSRAPALALVSLLGVLALGLVVGFRRG